MKGDGIYITKMEAIYTDKYEISQNHPYQSYVNHMPDLYLNIKETATATGNFAAELFDSKTIKELREISKKPGKNGFFVGAGAAQWAGSSRGTDRFPYKEQQGKTPFLTVINIAAGKLANMLGYADYIATDATACISGVKAMHDAMIMIKLGYIDRAIVFGWDDQINNATLEVFGVTKASLTKEDIESGKKPSAFDDKNGGFLIGHGFGYVLLENKKSIKKTKNKPIAEIKSIFVGAEYVGNPLTLTSNGYINAMKNAIKESGVKKSKISFIKAHGSGTVRNNEEESKAIKAVFNDKIPVTSYKPEIGHTMGPSGLIEMIIALEDLKKGFIRPIKNKTRDESQFLSKKMKAKNVKYFLCNSSGMGNVFASCVIKKIK